MKTITFHCETITPMFLAGADGQTPELRPPSIKGAMRFWWRAINGHLDLKTLKERESAIFGGTDNAGKSKMLIKCPEHEFLKQKKHPLVPRKSDKMQQTAINAANDFIIEITLTQEKISTLFHGKLITIFDAERLEALFKLTTMLGSIGKRSRRGMGAFMCSQIKATSPNHLLHQIHAWLNKFSNYYSIQDNTIVLNYNGRMEKYPISLSVEIGDKGYETVDALLLNISNITHKYNKSEPYKYGASLGKARGGRFASPIYMSVVEIENKFYPIITSLNTQPSYRDIRNVSLQLQNQVIEEVLR